MTPFKITVDMPGPVKLLTRTVEASSLSEALRLAAELDFPGWWPEECGEDVWPGGPPCTSAPGHPGTHHG